MLTNKTYIKTASSVVSLFYPRCSLKSGANIKGFRTNKALIKGLNNCDFVVVKLYWKPIGDSLLFLSVIQACYDYLRLARSTQPKWVIDSKFASLIRHIPILSKAIVVEDSLDWFKNQFTKGKKVALITDDDPFTMKPTPPIFNSEEYVYPKFIEQEGNLIAKEHPSRPARYFLTFEREVGKVLLTEPNLSLPDFIMGYSRSLKKKCIDQFGFDPDSPDLNFIGIVSQANLVEKRFGSVRFLKLAEKLTKKDKKTLILLLANPDEESPSEWIKVKEIMQRNKNIRLLKAEDFELLAYIFARCKLVVGNDTGFSHLAAMSKKSLKANNVPVFIIYSRHDYGKWSTGKNNVHPITTKLSEYLKENNMSISRDKIDVAKWGLEEWAYSVSVSKVAKVINKEIENLGGKP